MSVLLRDPGFVTTIIVGFGILFLFFVLPRIVEKAKYDAIDSNNTADIKWMTVNQFFVARKRMSGDIVGVYILYNKSKDMYYVGQAKKIYFRVNQHLTGHGNGDVYADHKYGDEFLVALVPLIESGCGDLDLLERRMISKYDAYKNGYNRTSGNR